MPTRAERGFTTVEMWTAAAVALALLCCCAYGFVASAGNAKRSQCITHLHTIYTAVASYALDNDGSLPPYAFDSVGTQSAQQASFIGCLGGQGLNKAIWFCPADSHAHTSFKGPWGDFKFSSYGIPPATMARGKATEEGHFSLTLSGESASVLFCDQPARAGVSAHGSVGNGLFADGHVAHINVRDLGQ